MSEGTSAAALTNGRPRVLVLSGGEEQIVEVRLSGNTLARLHLESRGLPVWVSLRGPDGAEVVAERPVAPGISSYSWIASAPGRYQVVFQAQGKLGARVNAELAALRPSGPADVRWVEQERALEAASARDPPAPGAGLDGAIADVLAAASAAPACEAAVARRRAASLLRSLGREDQAIPALQAAVEADTRCHGRRRLPSTCLELASAYMAAGRFDASRAALECTSRGVSAARNPALAGDLDLARAQLDTYSLRVESAVHGYERARARFREDGDVVGEARCRLWEAYNHIAAGAPENAIVAGVAALRLWESIGDRRSRGRALQALALANQSLGRTQRALDLYLEARDTLSPGRDAAEMAAVFNGLSELYLGSGAMDRGLEFARLAADLNRGNPGAHGHSLGLLAQGYYSAGDYDQSALYARQELDTFTSLGDAQRTALAQRDLARALKAAGRLETAIPLLREALEALRTSGATYLQALALSDLGQALAEGDRLDEAVDCLERALALQRQVGSAPDEVLALANLARVRARMGNLQEALRDSTAALARAEELRAALAGFDLRTSYFASVSDFQEFHVDLLMSLHEQDPRAGYDVQAFLASEQSRARTLVDELAEQDPGPSAAGGGGRRPREQELARTIDRLAREIVSRLPADETETKRLVSLYTRARAEHDQVVSAIRAAEPSRSARGSAAPIDPRTLQTSLLDDDTAFVEYFVGAKRSFGWLITKEGLTSFVLPPRDALATVVERVGALVRSPLVRPGESADEYVSRVERAKPEFERAAAELSRMVLGPWLTGRREGRLVVTAHECLQHVPFSALPWPPDGPGRPLLESREVVRVPSAAALAALRPAASPSPSKILVVADPVFSVSDPRVATADASVPRPDEAAPSTSSAAARLENYRSRGGVDLRQLARLAASGDEASAITAAAAPGSVTVLRGFAATRERLRQAATDEYRVIHVASHSFVPEAHPELSAVVLSMVDENGRPTDGLLLSDDVAAMKLTADLVVLSACETALGRDVRGEGIMGLTRGFFHAGARQVMASLWKVDDRATLELMRRFYAGLLREGLRPAAALRRAQLSMAGDPSWAFPFYWSAFELHGDWR